MPTVAHTPRTISEKGWKDQPVATATSRSGATYTSGGFASSTRLAQVPAEVAALALATACGDPWITHIRSTAESEAHVGSTLPLLAQHSARTGLPLDWDLAWNSKDSEGASRYTHVAGVIPGWTPAAEAPPEWGPDMQARPNWLPHDATQPLLPQLQAAVQLGMARATTTPSKNRTAYGAAVLGNDGRIYYGGQYTAIGTHAENTAVLSAFAQGATAVTHLALASTKSIDDTCECCGICRQFLVEVATGTGTPLQVVRFASGPWHAEETSLEDYLPNSWSPLA